MATQTEALSTTPSVQVVGNAFVEQYYHILHHSPELVYKFYEDSSVVSRPDQDGVMISVTTMKGINDKICSLDYTNYKAEIKTADAQESYKEGVIVLVTGCLTGKEDNLRRKFSQSFFLAPQDKGYFVLNDVFRYVDESESLEINNVSVDGTDDNQSASLVSDPSWALDPPMLDQASFHEEEIQNVEEESQNLLETEGQLVNENKATEPESHPIENRLSVATESISSTVLEDAPKMSYASIVSSQTKKGSSVSTKVYVPAKAPTKTEKRPISSVAQSPTLEASDPIASSSINSPDSNNAHDEGEGHSIYIRNLPMSATVSQLELEFKKFGPIKQGGVQVRSNKQGFCFGFVEFQDLSSMQNAIQASPVTIGGREAVVEIKRTTTRSQ